MLQSVLLNALRECTSDLRRLFTLENIRRKGHRPSCWTTVIFHKNLPTQRYYQRAVSSWQSTLTAGGWPRQPFRSRQPARQQPKPEKETPPQPSRTTVRITDHHPAPPHAEHSINNTIADYQITSHIAFYSGFATSQDASPRLITEETNDSAGFPSWN